MTQAVIGFASGIAVSVIAAVFGRWLQTRTERRHTLEQTLFEVYMMFLELVSTYFWVASHHMRNETVPQDIRDRCRHLAFRIADKLREQDDLPFLEDLVTVLMAEPAYPTAMARHDAMNQLADRIGERVNPRYKTLISSLTPANVEAATQKALWERNSPGNMW